MKIRHACVRRSNKNGKNEGEKTKRAERSRRYRSNKRAQKETQAAEKSSSGRSAFTSSLDGKIPDNVFQ